MNTDTTKPQTSPEAISARPNLQRNPKWKNEGANRPDVYSLITERIITMLEQEIIPWKKPWKGGEAGFPKNFVTGRRYSGINAFLLAMTHFESPYFLTFKQANDKGGHIRKGEKGFPIIYCNKSSAIKEDKETGETTTEHFGFLRYYTVFNVAQTEGITIPVPEGETVKEFHPLEDCEAIRQGYRGSPEIIHKEQRAYYSPVMDIINMPRPGSFTSGRNLLRDPLSRNDPQHRPCEPSQAGRHIRDPQIRRCSLQQGRANRRNGSCVSLRPCEHYSRHPAKQCLIYSRMA